MGQSSGKYLRGALILTIAGLLVKIIGSVNRILLSRLLGGEGIGLYQMAYPIYLLLLALTSAGIPVAISIVVSEYMAKAEYSNVRRVFRVSLGALALLGLALALALFMAAGWLVRTGIIHDGRAYYALVALTPAIFFATLLASFRGFFQGQQLMTPSAVSQVAEQLVRVITMLTLAFLLLPRGLEYAAAGAAFGAVPGSFAGLCVLSGFYYYYRKSWQQRASVAQEPLGVCKLLQRLLFLALPVSCANILVPVTSGIDMLLVPQRLLAAGFTTEQATTLFGYLTGMAQPLIMMATIPTLSLATSLVPAVSSCYVLKDQDGVKKQARSALKLCCLVTLPAALGMIALAEPIARLLYGTAAAGTAILHSGPAVWGLGLQQVTTGILQGLGAVKLPMLTMLAGICAKIAAVWFLTNANWQIAGAAWATCINFLLAAALNLWALRRYGITIEFTSVLKIFIATVLMGLAAREIYQMLLPLGINCAALAALVAAVCLYLLLLPFLKIVSKNEICNLPFLKRWLK